MFVGGSTGTAVGAGCIAGSVLVGSVLVGLVGAGGLGQIMRQQIAGFDYHALGSTLACFVVLTALVDALSAGLRRTLR